MWDVPWIDIKADIHTAAVTMWILFMAALMSTSHSLQYIVKKEKKPKFSIKHKSS